MEIIKTIKKGNKIAKIYIDEYADSPREWDNLGKMICFHKRYNLGDKHTESSKDFDSFEELRDYLIKEKNAIVILPLFLFDHSGITISTSAFNNRWDFGQVGFIYATKEDVLREYNVKKITKKAIINFLISAPF